MKVLLTGGAGFIGGYVLDALANTGVDVRICDIREPVHARNRPIEVIRGDATNLEVLVRAVAGVDVVIHLIGVRDAQLAEADPDTSFRRNVLSLHNVLEACRLGGVRRVVFPSSAAVYGRTDKVPVSEEDHTRPTGIYAYHKWLCEELIRGYRATYGVHYTIFRVFNAWGPGNRNIIDHCIRAVKDGQPITVFGADQLRDFIFVGDVARAFALVVGNGVPEDRTINLGTGRGWTIRGVVRLVQNVFPGLGVTFAEKDGFIPYHSIADVTLARTLLDFFAESSEALFARVIKEMANDA